MWRQTKFSIFLPAITRHKTIYLLYFGLGVMGPITSLGSLRPAMFLALTLKSYSLSFFKPFTEKCTNSIKLLNSNAKTMRYFTKNIIKIPHKMLRMEKRNVTLIDTLVTREIVGLLPAASCGILVLHDISDNLLASIVPWFGPRKSDSRLIDVNHTDMSGGIRRGYREDVYISFKS